MTDFDVILGMDWLAKNHSYIDYWAEGSVFILSFGLSTRAMKARKLIKHWAWAFLASVTKTNKVNIDMSFVPVVKDFQDVFPENSQAYP